MTSQRAVSRLGRLNTNVEQAKGEDGLFPFLGASWCCELFVHFSEANYRNPFIEAIRSNESFTESFSTSVGFRQHGAAVYS